MPTKSKKVFIAVSQPGNDKSVFFRLWHLVNLDGPLAPLPEPTRDLMAEKLEQMRRQQVHIDEIKRLCHVRA